MFNLKPKTSVRKINEHFEADETEKLRSSQNRREHLEKLAIMHAGKDVYVELGGDEASANIADSSSEIGWTDRITITIPTEIPDQAMTNLDEEVWDMMYQKISLYHELAHIEYTDWPAIEEVLYGDGNGNYGITDEHHGMFFNWFNILEDAFIQKMMVQRFDIENEIRITNQNGLMAHRPDRMVSLHEATSISLMEYKHPIGWIDKLLDDNNPEFQFLNDDEKEIFVDNIYPVIEELAPDIVTETDAVDRTHMVYDLYSQIGVYFDQSVAPGTQEDHSFDFPEDIDPADAPDSGGQKADLDVDDDGNTKEIEPIDDDEMEGVEQDIQQDYSGQVDHQKQHDEAQGGPDYKAWKRVIDHEYDEGTTLSINILDDDPVNGTFDQETQREAKKLSQPLASDLKQRLQKQQRTQKQKKKKSGKVDSSQVHKSQQGSTNIMSKNTKPNQKDYSCILTVDRSGSMSGQMSKAEIGVGAFAYALEEIGVSVAILSVNGREGVCLEKDFDEDVDEAKKKIFRGYSGGGTPLSDALALARPRIKSQGSQPFIITVTDGLPDHRERYRDNLHACDFPVLGVYLKESFDDNILNDAGYFHQLETRSPSDVFTGVKNLGRKVMF